jgi:hypothetical protein
MNKLVIYKQRIDTTARVESIYIHDQKHATSATCANDIPYVRVSTYRDTTLEIVNIMNNPHLLADFASDIILIWGSENHEESCKCSSKFGVTKKN